MLLKLDVIKANGSANLSVFKTFASTKPTSKKMITLRNYGFD